MLTDEKKADLKLKNPGMKLVELMHPIAGSVVVRKPGPADYQKFLDRKADPDQRTKAARMLFLDCAVYPAGEELTKLVDEFPALPESMLDRLLEMAGAAARVEKKEL